MRVWVVGSEVTGQDMAAALAEGLRALQPGHDYVQATDDDSWWSHVETGDGALLCVTPLAAANDQVFFDLGRLQAAVGTRGFVAPVLMDLTPDDLAQTPLAIFQSTRAQRNDLEALVEDLARRAGAISPTIGSDPAEPTWFELLQRIGDVPGAGTHLVIVTLILPERLVSFGFDPGDKDSPWKDSIGAALRELAGSPLAPPPFDPKTLAPLDVETSRWIELPRRLSRIQTSHLGLVSPLIVEQAGVDARLLARRARDHYAGFAEYGGQKVLPWKFMLGDGKLVLMNNVR